MAPPPVCWFLAPADTTAGAGQRCIRLAEALSKTGLAVRFIRPPASADLPPLAQAVAAVRAQWLAARPLCAYVEVPGYAGEPWRLVARELGIPLLTTWHPVFWMAPAVHQDAIKASLQIFVESCQQVLTETPEVRLALAADGVLDTTMVSNGVDTQRFSPKRRSAARRATWGIDADQPVVLAVGRLLPEKNLGLLADTCRAVLAAYPRAVCLVAGSGSAAEGLAADCPQLRQLGHLTGDELAEVYASADIFVFTSTEDMFGNVALEAAASGLAVVAFDRASAGNHLRGAAQTIPLGNAEAFIAATVALAGAPDERRRLGTAARTAVLPLTWAASARQFRLAIERAQRVPPRHALPGVIPVTATIHAHLPADPASEPFATVRLLTARGHRITWQQSTTLSELTVDGQTRPLRTLIDGLPADDGRGAWSRRSETAEGRLCAWADGREPVAKPLRIAACIAAPFVRAGAAIRFHQLTAGLRRLGHAVQIQAESGATTPPPPQADAAERQARMSRLVAGMRQTWAADRPDVAYIEVLDSFGRCAAEAAQTLGIPWVANWHPLSAWGGEAARVDNENALRAVAVTAAALIAEDPAEAADLDRLGLRCAALIGNGVDLQRFTPDQRNAAVRARWDCDVAVLAVGRLHAAKNVAELIRIHAALSQLPRTKLIIVGDGPERDALSAAMPGALFLGSVADAVLPTVYASADLFVFPGKVESFGLVVAEALASGLPVIGYDRAAVAQLVTDPLAGVRVPLDGDLAAAITTWCRQTPASDLSQAAARQAVAACSWQHSATALAAVLTQAAGALPAAPTAAQ